MSIEQGYKNAFYNIAAMMGLSARPGSPKEVWEQEMRPRLTALLRSSASRDEVLEEAAKVADKFAKECRDSGEFGPSRSPESCYEYAAAAIRNLKSGALKVQG